MTALESRTRLLLWAYPSGYRSERGDEILGTLIESAPLGRKWPTLKDSLALVVGGLRVRTAQNRRLGAAANWRLALLLALVLYLGPRALLDSSQIVERPNVFGPDPWYEIVRVLLTVAALVLVWLPVPRATAVTAVLAAVFSVVYEPVYLPHLWSGGVIQAVLLIVMAVCALGRDRMPRSWLLLVAAPVYVYLHTLWLGLNLPGTVPLLIHAVGAVVLIWMIFDARPIIAVAVCLIITGVVWQVESPGEVGGVWSMSFTVAYLLSAVAILLATWRVRRQAVL